MSIVTDASLMIVLQAKDEAEAIVEKAKGNFGSLGGVMSAVGTGALAIGAAVMTAGAASVKMAKDFNSAMTQVQTQGGISAETMESMKQGVLDASAQFGISATDMAKALMPIAAEGYSGADGIKVLSTAAMGAKAYNSDLMTTTMALTTAMKDYNFSAGQSQHVMDVLGAATASGRTSFQDLAGSLATILPLSSSLKVSFEGVMGSMTQMTSQGTPAAVAAQNIRFALSALEKPSSQAKTALDSVGLTTSELVKTLQSGPEGLVNTLAMVQEAVGKKFPEGSAAYTAALSAIMGGVKGLQPVLELTGTHLAATKAAVDGLANASKNGGYTAQSWAAVQSELATKIEIVRATVEKYMIMLGQQLIPIVSEVVGAVGSALPVAFNAVMRVVTPLGAAFSQVFANIKDGLGWVDDLSGFVLTLARSFGASNSTLQSINGAIQTFGSIVNIAFSIVKTVAVVIIQALLLQLHVLLDVIQFVGDHFNWFAPILAIVVGGFIAWEAALAASAIQGAIVGIVEKLALFAMQGGITAAVNGIMTASFAALDVALDANPFFLIAAAIVALVAVVVLIATHFQQVKNALGEFGNYIKTSFLDAWNAVINFFKSIPGAIGSALSAIGGAIVKGITAAVNFIPTALEFAIHAFLVILIGWPILLITGFIFITNVFAKAGEDVVQAVVAWGPKILTAIVNAITSLPGKISSLLVNVYNTFTKLIGDVTTYLSVAIPELINAIIMWFAALPGRVWSAIQSLGSAIGNTFSAALDATGRNLSAWAGAIQSWFTNLPSSIGSWISGLGPALEGMGRSILQSIANGISGAWNAVTGALTSALHSAVGSLPGPLQSIAHGLGLQAGGIVKARPGGTVIRVAEGGEDEWVIPASKLRQLILQAGADPSGVSSLPGSSTTAAGGGASTVTVVSPIYLDGRAIARVVTKHQSSMLKQQASGLTGAA